MADLLPRIEPLLLEAEALDLVEVLARLEGDHIVCRHTVDGPGKRETTFQISVWSMASLILILVISDPGLLSPKFFYHPFLRDNVIRRSA